MNIQLIIWIISFIILNNAEYEKFRSKRNIISSKIGSLYGLFVALAVPIDLPNENVFISYNFEANYHIPKSLSELQNMGIFVPITQERSLSDSLNRKMVYKIIENQFDRFGYSGKHCLLRSICEISHIPLDGNGVLSDIFHIIFTPSTSKIENLTSYYIAEKQGQSGTCDSYAYKCPINLLNNVTKLFFID